jgi:urea transport system ATP-binding protein
MLTVNQLSAGYGRSEVIHDLSFQTGENEILAIMGRNGMGKTTLLKSLMGILPARAGKVMIGDLDITKKDTYERVNGGLAFVPQGRMIFSNLTVSENILTGAQGKIGPGAFDEIYTLFPVLKDMRKRKGGNLSGGQQQQLAIARALITNPRVLILDEPTEGIQPSIIKDIARSLREIRNLRKLSIVVSEQVLSFVKDVCDRVLIIESGRFVHEDFRETIDTEKIHQFLSV